MNKYRNKKTVVNGISFDSKAEAARYQELMLMREAGEIIGLRLQPEFTLQPAFITPEGEVVRAIRYRADFSYRKVNGDGIAGAVTVEDVKGRRTKDYEIKRKLMEGLGIHVTEVPAR